MDNVNEHNEWAAQAVAALLAKCEITADVVVWWIKDFGLIDFIWLNV